MPALVLMACATDSCASWHKSVRLDTYLLTLLTNTHWCVSCVSGHLGEVWGVLVERNWYRTIEMAEFFGLVGEQEIEIETADFLFV